MLIYIYEIDRRAIMVRSGFNFPSQLPPFPPSLTTPHITTPFQITSTSIIQRPIIYHNSRSNITMTSTVYIVLDKSELSVDPQEDY